MSKRCMNYFLSIIALFTLAATASADIKVKTRTTVGGQSFEGTTYIKKSRQRDEQSVGGMSMTNITQCDLQRMIQLNDRARTYLITPFGGATSTTDVKTPSGAQPDKTVKTRRGGIITSTYKVTDTGERKKVFGLVARHLKVSMTTESSPDACSASNMKMEMDGWYIDLDYGLDCDRTRLSYGGPQNSPACVDEYRTKTIGVAKLGYPIDVTTIIYGDNGAEISRSKTEVLELSSAPVDAALFEIPAGYTEAKNQQEFYASAAMSSMASSSGERSSDSNVNAVTNSNSAAEPTATGIPGMTPATAPKKAGAVRIGLVLPAAKMSEGIPASTAAEAVRNTFAGFLNGPSIEVVALNARMPDQAFAEARQSQCDYVLFSGLTQKKGGGMFGKIAGGIAGVAGSAVPYGGSAGEAAARTAIYTTATIATSVKAKDEVSLDYKLHSAENAGSPVIQNTTKVKARSDGEDVITPQVEGAAGAIIAAVKK
jgi:hypothetical protein